MLALACPPKQAVKQTLHPNIYDFEDKEIQSWTIKMDKADLLHLSLFGFSLGRADFILVCCGSRKEGDKCCHTCADTRVWEISG